jgi:hypothetical protein
MMKPTGDRLAPSTLDELKRRWERCLFVSDAAVCRSPQTYARIRGLARHVLTHPVDIDDYAGLARRMSRLIEQMGCDTLFFHYYHDHIDPLKFGRAQYFRPICRDLLDRLDWFAQWRASRRRLRVVATAQPQ